MVTATLPPSSLRNVVGSTITVGGFQLIPIISSMVFVQVGLVVPLAIPVLHR